MSYIDVLNQFLVLRPAEVAKIKEGKNLHHYAIMKSTLTTLICCVELPYLVCFWFIQHWG